MSAPDSRPPNALPAATLPWTAAACAGIFLVGLVLYARTLGYPFLDWDDPIYVLDNRWVQGFSLENLRAIFTQGILGGLLPVHLLSYSFDHALWGLDPSGYHLHSLLLNATNGALALWVVLEISRRPAVAVLAALFFAVHPTHVSSTAWISARKELLYTTFLLLSTASYLLARRDGRLRRPAYLASIGLFALGAMSKTTIAVYPAFFVLVDLVLDARLAPERRRALAHHLKTKLPYLAIGIAAVVANLFTQAYAPEPYAQHPFTYALVKGHAAWRYLWLLLGLMPGQPIYEAPALRTSLVAAALTLLPFALGLGALAWAAWRRHDQAGLALAWLVIGLVPPLAFPLVTYMADRYLYAPSLGFCWLVAIAIDAVASRIHGPLWRGLFVCAAAILVWGRLYPLTWSYLPVWSSSLSMWTYAVDKSSDPRALSGLAAALIVDGRPQEALDKLSGIPLDLRGFVNRASANYRLGRYHDALRDTEHGLILAERGASPYLLGKLRALRADVFTKLGRMDDAEAEWNEVLRLDPTNRSARAWHATRSQRLKQP